ncbi:MAG TPA: hypothetical protein VFF92_01715 [Dehalococcoidales bacterium]|nr:hypothetical protein [Dehalococcoidales bacterium]
MTVIKLKKGGDKMQLVVLKLISGVVADVIRQVCGYIKKTWPETAMTQKDGLILSPVAIKERSHRARIAQD